ncbi:MAG TPA: hypothetical protein P5132_09460 [Bacteroidales bacterium]|nr:hypothetical protein [Bacteroidales bacterium]
MRRLKLFFLTLMALTLGFVSCEKDEDAKLINELFFQIPNAEFISDGFPGASSSLDAPGITSVYGNSNVLAGGSNPISVSTSDAIKNILVGVQGQKGYYKIAASDNKSTNYLYIIYLIINQDLQYEDFTIVIAVLDNAGLVSTHETINVSRVDAGTGKLQVSCSWDKANDVDLHLVEPAGEEIYYGNSYSANGGDLDVDSNAGCSIDNINNENITYSETDIVESGDYIVRVDLFSNCNVTSNTNYVVTVRYNGDLITPKSGTNPFYGSFTPDQADYGGEGDGYTVMTFNIGSAKKSIEKTILMDGFKFVYPNQNVSKPKNISPDK